MIFMIFLTFLLPYGGVLFGVSFLLVLCLACYIFVLRKKNLVSLQDKELFEAAFTNNPDFIFLLDKNLNIRKTNYYTRAKIALPTKDETLGLGDVLKCKYAVGAGKCGVGKQCTACPIRNLLNKTLAEKATFNNEEVKADLLLPDGQTAVHNVLLSASCLDIHNETFLFVAVHEICLEQAYDKLIKRANKKFQSVFDTLPLLCLLSDSTGRIIEMNKAYQDFFKIEYDKDKNENIFDLEYLSDDIKEKMRQGIPLSEDINLECWSEESKNDTPTASAFMRIMVDYLKNDEGEMDFRILIFVDNTMLHNALEEAKKERERAENADRMKSAFLANMSHEIRTPLNAIVGFSDLLANTFKEDEKQKYVEIIHHNNEQVLQLISDILDLSKIEANTLEFNWSDVELNGLLKDIEQTTRFKSGIDKEQLEINFVPGMDSPCVIHTERVRLSQVMNNFLTNALKFTKEGSITFGYERQEDGLYFYCRDTGCGIPAANLPAIFNRFVKLNNLKQGTGLGLAISHSIISKLEGTIGVESVEGEGTVFWFKLPVLPLEINTDENGFPIVTNLEKQKYIEPTNNNVKKTILIAEDIDDNYKLYESILENKYNLIHAMNGEEAIQYYLTDSPEAIIMDIRMPSCDGVQATEAIRQMSLSIPIIAITAYAFNDDKQKIMAGGFDAYLTKPVKADELLNLLTSMGI